jgi:hypothetical protein
MFKKFVATAVAATIVTTAIIGAAAVASILAEDERVKRKKKRIVEGALVQWLSNGMYMFPEPKKVVRIVDSEEHGTYIFVDGASTGIPLDEVVLQEDL